MVVANTTKVMVIRVAVNRVVVMGDDTTITAVAAGRKVRRETAESRSRMELP